MYKTVKWWPLSFLWFQFHVWTHSNHHWLPHPAREEEQRKRRLLCLRGLLVRLCIFHQDPWLHSLCFSIILLWFLAVFNHILWSFQSWHLLEWLLILIARLLNFQSLLKEFLFISKQVALHNAISFLGSQPYYPWADVFIFSPNFLEPYFENKLQVLQI